ncbi:hypothetical protein DIPPA_21021 [Diplonema papillatum]|nr:hypothetical protein DIPPA_21021 [Diplonema papillatum]KAJ9466530.1 hypothetical protein DIPPA_21021 [Diplonema papillatum]
MHRTGSSVEAWLAAVVAITLAATVSVDEGIDEGARRRRGAGSEAPNSKRAARASRHPTPTGAGLIFIRNRPSSSTPAGVLRSPAAAPPSRLPAGPLFCMEKL